MSIAPETRARLEQLVTEWNGTADRTAENATGTVMQDHLAFRVCSLRDCANELSALLSSLEPPQAQEPMTDVERMEDYVAILRRIGAPERVVAIAEGIAAQKRQE